MTTYNIVIEDAYGAGTLYTVKEKDLIEVMSADNIDFIGGSMDDIRRWLKYHEEIIQDISIKQQDVDILAF